MHLNQLKKFQFYIISFTVFAESRVKVDAVVSV